MVSLTGDFDDYVAFAFAYGTFSHDTVPGTQLRVPIVPKESRSPSELIAELKAAANAGIGELPAA